MATNLLILYPDLPLSASTITTDTLKTGSDAAYGVTGSRALIVQESAAGTTITTDYDLGAGITDAPNFVAVIGANMALQLAAKDSLTEANVNVYGDDNSSFTSPDSDTAAITSASLLGPRLQDYARLVTFATAYRYWRVQIGNASASQAFMYSKIFLGSYFDMGRDPIYPPIRQHMPVAKGFRAHPDNTIMLSWRGISDASKKSFAALSAQRDMMSFILWDQGDVLFDGDTLLYCQMTDASFITSGRNRWDIEATFRELSV